MLLSELPHLESEVRVTMAVPCINWLMWQLRNNLLASPYGSTNSPRPFEG